MKAIILNAGKGSRLAPFTDNNHKCLIEIGSRKIIDFQLEALRQAGISDVVIVVGHFKEQIIEYLKKYEDFKFTFIENEAYQTTNTAYSLLLTKKEMNDDFIYLNGDVLFDPEMLLRLVNSKHKNALAVEKKKCGEEEVKVALVKNRITSISKKVPVSKASGEFIGIAKFSKDILRDFKKALEETVIKEKLLKEYFEYALDKIVKKHTLTSVDISDLKTIEVDFPEDLEKAKKMFSATAPRHDKKRILFYVERDLHLPFLEPIHDYFKNNYNYDLAFSSPKYVVPSGGHVGIGLKDSEINRLKLKSKFVDEPEDFNPDATVVSDVSFSLKNCGKIVNVGHGIISKGGFYRDAPIVRRENLADLICVPGQWHKEILEKNVFVPIVPTGFIKSDKMFGPDAVKRSDFCKEYDIDEKKKIILYAPTFNPELSSIPVIKDKIKDVVTDDTILLIKLHSMTDIVYVNMYKELSRKNKNILFIENIDLTPSMMAADVMISDVSSAAVEFLFLNKPVIIFNNPRTSQYQYYDPDDIEYKAREACTVVNTLEELKTALDKALSNSDEFESKRRHYAEVLCYGRDGKSVERAAGSIDALLSGNLSSESSDKNFSLLLFSRYNRSFEEMERVINNIYNANPALKLQIYLFSDYQPEYDIAKLKIKKWISFDDHAEVIGTIKEIKTEYTFIAHDNNIYPYRWVERISNYFKWYPQTGAVNALTDRDDYNELLQKYFPKIKADDYGSVAHSFRHFIGADVSVGSVNGECFSFKSEILKEIKEIINVRSSKELIENFVRVLKDRVIPVKLALDVFVFSDKDNICVNTQNESSAGGSSSMKDRLIDNIEKNPWDIESRIKLYKIQKGLSDAEIKHDTKSSQDLTGSVEVSIILVTFNQLEYTKQCVESIIKNTNVSYEIVFVENASQDSTLDWLTKLCGENKNYKLISNNFNVGFTKAANQGIIAGTGRYILLLNNDTVVNNNWVRRMIDVADADEKIGIVGPISNEVSGFQIDRNAVYKDLRGMVKYAHEVQKKNKGEVVQFPRVAFLCTLIKRDLINKIGGLDERFSPGNFEDDDFCLRAQIAGFKTVIAKDVFIHHYGSKSFKAEGNSKYAERLLINKNIFTEKWGADPNEIWLGGKKIKSRNILYPISQETFSSSIDRFLIHVEEKDFGLARIEIKKAVESYHDAADKRGYEYNVLLNLAGNISLILEDFEEARTYFEQELNLAPNSSSACAGLAQVLHALGQYEGSKVMFEWAVKNDPANTKAVEGLAFINRHFGLDAAHSSLSEN